MNNDVIYEALQLSLYHIEYVTLSTLEYMGKFVNRCSLNSHYRRGEERIKYH